VGVLGFSVPILSLATLAWFGSLYAVTWFVAYLVHVFVSPEGAAWVNVWRAWRWLDREQDHRHELERYVVGIDERKGRQ
jgi:hypothetical protein